MIIITMYIAVYILGRSCDQSNNTIEESFRTALTDSVNCLQQRHMYVRITGVFMFPYFYLQASDPFPINQSMRCQFCILGRVSKHIAIQSL